MKTKFLFSAILCLFILSTIILPIATEKQIRSYCSKAPSHLNPNINKKTVNNMNNSFPAYGYTTTHSRLTSSQLSDTLNKYVDFSNILDELCTFTIPGLENTFVGTDSQSMVPQGICIADGYFLTTAYDSESQIGTVIYAITNDSQRKLKCVIELPMKIHAGGITFDGENIWICGSDEKNAGSRTGVMHRICFDDIRKELEAGNAYLKLDSNVISKFYISNSASFCTYYNERLWVGTFADSSLKEMTYGSLMSYDPFSVKRVDEKNHLVYESFLLLPNRAQGVCFAEYNDVTYMLLSRSYARNSYIGGNSFISEIRVYKPDFDSQSPLKITKKGNAVLTLSTPPMIEEICFDDIGNRLYAIFESGASKYSTNGKSPLHRCRYIFDKIAAIDIEKLIG